MMMLRAAAGTRTPRAARARLPANARRRPWLARRELVVPSAAAREQPLRPGPKASAERRELPKGAELSKLVDDAIRVDLYRGEIASMNRAREKYNDLSKVYQDSSNGTYNFDLFDALGRRTTRSGFRDKASAQRAFEDLQKRQVGVGLLDAFKSRISQNRDIADAVEEYLKSESRHESGSLGNLWTQIRNKHSDNMLVVANDFPPLLEKETVMHMTQAERDDMNRSIVQNARKLFVGEVDEETAHLSKVVAARLYQLNRKLPHAKAGNRPYAQAFKFVTQPNSSMRDFVDTVYTFQHESAGLQSEAVYGLLAEVLKIDRLPLLESIKTPEVREMAFSVQRLKDLQGKKTRFPLRIEEISPHKENRPDSKSLLMREASGATTLLEKARVGLRGAVGRNLPGDLAFLVGAHSPFPKPESTSASFSGPSSPLQVNFVQYLRTRASTIVDMHEQVRRTDVGEQALAPFAVWSDPIARKAVTKSEALRELVGMFEPRLASLRGESTDAVRTTDSMADSVDAHASGLSTDDVVTILTEKLSLRARRDVFALLARLGGASSLKGHEVVMCVEALVAAMGDQAVEVMPVLVRYFSLDPFWFMASVGHLHAKIEAIQAFMDPDGVKRSADDLVAATVHPSKAVYDRERAAYIPGGTENTTHRLVRNGLAFGPEDAPSGGVLDSHFEGLPEARITDDCGGSRPKFSWLGCDGAWHGNCDDALRTWYTSDIVGDAGSIDDESRLILCVRRQHELLSDTDERLRLHRAVRADSGDNLERALFRIVRCGHLSDRLSFDRVLVKAWPESRIVLDPAGHCSTIGRSKPIQRLLSSFPEGTSKEITKLLFPTFVQNFLGITPERVTAVNTILSPAHVADSASGTASGWEPRTSIEMEVMCDGLANRVGKRKSIELADERMRYFFDVEKIADVAKTQGVPLLEGRDEDLSNESWATRTVFLNNIPRGIDEETLKSVMESTYGPVERASLHHDQLPLDDVKLPRTKPKRDARDAPREELYAWLNKVRDEPVLANGDFQDIAGRVKTQLDQLDETVDVHIRLAKNEQFWLDLHWNKVDLINVVPDAATHSGSSHATAAEPSYTQLTESEIAALSSAHISAALLFLVGKCEDALGDLKTLKGEIKMAEKEVRSAKAKFVKATGASWPEKMGEFIEAPPGNLQKNEIEQFTLKRDAVLQKMRRADEVLRSVPGARQALLKTTQVLLDFRMEAQRRRTLVEAALDKDPFLAEFFVSNGESVAGPDTDKDAFVHRGTLQSLCNISENTGSAEASSPVDILPAGTDATARPDDADDNDDDGDYGNSAVDVEADLATSREGADFPEGMTSLYGAITGRAQDGPRERMDRVKNFQSTSKKGRIKGESSREILKKVYDEVLSGSGAYAFITFTDEKGYGKIMSPSNKVFGITLTGSQRRSVNLAKLEGKKNVKNLNNLNCAVQPATEKVNLYILGMRKGLSAAEVARVLEGKLEGAFPRIRLNFGRDSKALTDGSCLLRFRTFAESLAAYQVLNGEDVLGSKIVVGWKLNSDRESTKKTRRNWYTARPSNPMDHYTR